MRMELGVSGKEGGLAILVGLLGAAAFPPLGLWPLMFASLAIYLRLLRDQNAQGARNLGLVYGFAFALGTMYWFFAVFKHIAPPLIALMAIYFGILSWAIGLTKSYQPWTRVVMTAA